MKANEPTKNDGQNPGNIDRRSFLMRNAVIGAAAVMTGKAWTAEARAQQAAGSGRAQTRRNAVAGP